jgi:hypothetical protein
MEISGTPQEGWMTFVPLAVLVLIVVYVLGGPVQFLNTLNNWAIDFFTAVAGFFRHL